MQMFHMSSLKRGLDQAVLQGMKSKGNEVISGCSFFCLIVCVQSYNEKECINSQDFDVLNLMMCPVPLGYVD